MISEIENPDVLTINDDPVAHEYTTDDRDVISTISEWPFRSRIVGGMICFAQVKRGDL